MQKLLLPSLLLAFGMAVAAQTSQTTQMAAGSAPAAEPAISSNGPVVADYGKHPAEIGNSTEAKIAKEVRHELLMLPYYSLFDDLEYSVQDRTVTLSGNVTAVHSQTRQDAERAVKRIEGVDKVINNIQVLPPNPLDEQARERVFRALSNAGGLSQYFWEAAPSIHIIVQNQRLTLKGYVLSEGDKSLAGITANQVRDLFQVTNDLQVVR